MHTILIFIIIILAIIIGILIGGIVTYYFVKQKQKKIASLQNSSLNTENSFPLKKMPQKNQFYSRKTRNFCRNKMLRGS